MLRLLIPAVGLTILVGAHTALAAEAVGTVLSVDQAAGVITLDDGTVFHADDGVDLSGLEPGTKVVLTYEPVDGANIVSDVAM